MSEYEGRDTEVQHDRRVDDSGEAQESSIRMDMPPIETDDSGIPTFVFKDELRENDRPSKDRKSLEVVLLWREAVMSVGHYAEPQKITVGDHKTSDFRVAAEGLTVDKFSLLDTDGDDFVLNWTEAMSMEVRNAEGEILDQEALIKRQSISSASSAEGEGVQQYKIGLHDRVAIQIGAVTFVIQYVSPARIIATSLLKSIDYYFTKILGLSFLAHIFFILALLITPARTDLEDDLFKNPDRFAKLLLKEPEEIKTPKKIDLSGAKGGGKHKDKEGKFGKVDKPKKDALASKKGAPKVDPNKREKDRKIAQQSGIFKALKGSDQSSASDVFGPGGLGTGINDAMGGMKGTSSGDAGGAGGMGSRGTGGGGGGNSLGIGGFGNGNGRGGGGTGNVELGGRGASKYKVVPSRTVTKGCITDQQAMKAIRRVQSQAKYCYEKELQKNPNLEGKVTTMMNIGPTGRVSSSRVTTSTMRNAAVEQCLLRVVQRIQFPPCKGGGTANIAYPWIFKGGS